MFSSPTMSHLESDCKTDTNNTPNTNENSDKPIAPDNAKTHGKADSGHDGLDEADYEAAHAHQFYRDEQMYWDTSYTTDEPPTRGGKDIGTIRPVKPKPPPTNNPK
ncbi:hypothetical protein F4776DRAFT_306757 [Hypoxylon sp. NC0597]|nr:hypothetical protein F4776DRAFT_306757 [Hypoxylon sp. NC0597]